MSEYTELSVVVLQTTGDTNCIAFTSVVILLISYAVSVSDVKVAMFLCGTVAFGGLPYTLRTILSCKHLFAINVCLNQLLFSVPECPLTVFLNPLIIAVKCFV